MASSLAQREEDFERSVSRSSISLEHLVVILKKSDCLAVAEIVILISCLLYKATKSLFGSDHLVVYG